MAMTVSMPQLGETVTEGTILRWLRQVGDQVAEGDVLVEISTDKVDTEIPSPVSGVVSRILVGEGETVGVDTPLVEISDHDELGSPAITRRDSEEETEARSPGASSKSPTNVEGRVLVEMPQLGETVTEGTILRWARQVGETVVEGDVLVEISTDKVDTEIPSPASGILKEILVSEGNTVEVGEVLGAIEAGGEAPSSVKPEEAEAPVSPWLRPEVVSAAPVAARASLESDDSVTPKEPEPTVIPKPELRGRLLSPVVRRLVREHDLDITKIQGSGEGGRITRRDVEAVIGTKSGGAPEKRSTEGVKSGRERHAAPEIPEKPSTTERPVPPVASGREKESDRAEIPGAASVSPPPPTKVTEASEEVPLDRLRLRIGENMTKAKQTAAHVWSTMEVDFERVERVRRRHKEEFRSKEGFSLTYLPFVARATVDALHDFPLVNSSYYLEEKKAVFHKVVNLGIAIDLDQKGLVVATVRNADSLRLVGLARGIRKLAEKAAEGNLGPDDVVGSTFSITNLGPFGSFMTAPIINVPNTGILAIDTVTKRPTVVQGTDGEDVIAIRHIGYVSLTWDHRAFDGSTAVMFLQRIKQNLETWDWEQELS